jgi:hypothetical protein
MSKLIIYLLLCLLRLLRPLCHRLERVMKNGDRGGGLAREERLQIMLSPEELEAVDSFRFHHRMPSRAAAVRELLRHGLKSAGAVLENAGVKSGEYGVLKPPKRVRAAVPNS